VRERDCERREKSIVWDIGNVSIETGGYADSAKMLEK
jgi:hypothetical protein